MKQNDEKDIIVKRLKGEAEELLGKDIIHVIQHYEYVVVVTKERQYFLEWEALKEILKEHDYIGVKARTRWWITKKK